MTVADDIRFAFRSLRSRPGFLVVALATLAVGIGANIAVFTLVNAVLLRPLPFGDRSDRVVTVHATHRSLAEDWEDARLSYLDLQDLRRSGALEDAAGFVARNFTLQDGNAERVSGGSVTPNLFPLLGVAPVMGRAFREDDAAPPGLESVVIITHGLWQRRLGGRGDVIGHALRMNDRTLTIVGVMPPGFAFPERQELYLPLRWESAPRAQRTVATFGLLKPGQTLEQAQREIDAVAVHLARAYPSTHHEWTLRVMMFRDLMVDGGDRRLTTALLAAVVFVLLIGCANLAGLLLARGEARRREFAVRAALGARRSHLVRGTLVESAVVAALGTVLGVIAAAWALEALPLAFADGLPYWVDLRPDARIVLFTLGLTAVTAILMGAAPGLRFSQPDVNDALKSSSTGSTASRGVQRLRAALVVAQVALSVGLLTAALLMVQSFVALQAAEGGFEPARLLTFRTYISGDRYDDPAARAAEMSRLVGALRALRGVDDAAITTSIPTDDGGEPIRIVTGRDSAPETGIVGIQVAASPGLFGALGVPLEGRTFTEAEFSDSDADVVVIGRRLAERLWPRQPAIDRPLGILAAGRVEWRRVIGVVGDVVYEEFGETTEQSEHVVYFPFARVAPRTTAALVRTAGEPQSAVAAVRELMRERFPGLPAYDVRTMEQVRTYTTWEQRVFGQVMAAFAGIAVLLAWIGVYGLVAYAVARRTREIGVRVALGAQRSHVVRMVASDIGRLALAGVGLGVLLGSALARALEASVFGVDARDPRLLAGAAAAMAAAMFLAAWWPARRATRIQPIVALRCE